MSKSALLAAQRSYRRGLKSRSSGRCKFKDIRLLTLNSHYLGRRAELSASKDLKKSVIGSHYVIVSTPTHYDESTNVFDTSSVEV